MSDQNHPIPSTKQEKAVDYSHGPIVARPDPWYRIKQSIVVAICIGGGIWCAIDGFYRWPKQNREWDPTHSAKPPHTGYDIPLNKALGLILPPVGILLLVRVLRSTRGEYRLEGETLHVPGHPPIPLFSIRLIDKAIWERKGIARLEYEVNESGQRNSFILDDIAYLRDPTDKILERIEAYAASVTPVGPAVPDNPAAQ